MSLYTCPYCHRAVSRSDPEQRLRPDGQWFHASCARQAQAQGAANKQEEREPSD